MNLFENQDSNENYLPFIIPEKEGYNFQKNDTLNCFEIEVPEGKLLYFEDFINQETSKSLKEYFCKKDKNENFENIKWNQDAIKIYGKEVLIPRLSAYYGDENKIYHYSNLVLIPNKWNKQLLFIKEKLEKTTKDNYNCVLMNWYRSGEDYMNWHADNEKELGRNPIIASINLGATRKFRLRKNDKSEEKIEFLLKNGSLLVMKGTLQHHWQHAVPKEKKIKDDRINLTFRKII